MVLMGWSFDCGLRQAAAADDLRRQAVELAAKRALMENQAKEDKVPSPLLKRPTVPMYSLEQRIRALSWPHPTVHPPYMYDVSRC